MLLLDEAVHIDARSGSALVTVTDNSTFYIPGKGVPAWVGLEYMGQTAALIGGLQQQAGVLADHTGFLLGSRQFSTTLCWFGIGTTLLIQCEQTALVGDSLANFSAEIRRYDAPDDQPLASAILSVFRQPPNDEKSSELPS